MGRVHLTLTKKVKVLEELKKGNSASAIAIKYGVAKSTIFSIKKQRNNIMKRVHCTFSGPGTCKTLRGSEVAEMEKKLYKWFLKARENNVPIDGKILKEKAKFLHQKTYPGKAFRASDGWLQNFKKRYGIRLLKITGEKVSSKPELVAPFFEELADKINKLDLNPDQIYNADESSLYWKLLPNKTFVSSNEKSAPGRKAAKERITFLSCANATGNHKLTPVVIGKSKSPRSFKNFVIPVHYENSKTAWMTSFIFKKWFDKRFIPQVRSYLRSKGLDPKAILLLDNAPCHPSADNLVSDDGKIIAVFMPPNVTALIQPMDQNVIRITKLKYRNALLSSLVSKQPNNFETSLKGLTLKDAVTFLFQAWQSIKPELIKQSFKTLISKCYNETVNNDSDSEDSLPLAVIQRRLRTNVSVSEINRSIQLFRVLAPSQEFSLDQINEWNNDPVQEEQIDIESSENTDSEPEVVEPPLPKISHREAVAAFNTIIQWSEENEIDFDDLTNLLKLREIAIVKGLNVTKQTTMLNYFRKD